MRSLSLCLASVLLFGCHDDAPLIVDAAGVVHLPIDGAVPDGAEAQGPYPIILVHGFFGFANIGPVDYFYGVADALRAVGRTVYTPVLDAFNSSAARGAELVSYIAMVRMETGARKVVLVAHSQGGLDSRWAATQVPDSIAAIVTIATPHRGSKLADVALGLAPGVATSAADALIELLGGAVDAQGTPDTDLAAALATLSTAGSAAFNASTPDAPGVAYYSIAGRSLLRDAKACGAPSAPFISTWDSQLDPLDPTLLTAGTLLATAELPATPVEDGFVTGPSAQWGHFLGCIPADHIEEICQPLGAPAGIGNHFDCLGFYRGLEAYLGAQGF